MKMTREYRIPLNEEDKGKGKTETGENSVFMLIPVGSGTEVKRLEIDADETPFTEATVPFGETILYMGAIRVPGNASCIRLKGEFPDRWFDLVRFSDELPEPDPARPFVHYSPEHGWCNDPNGLVYSGGIYHFYHQYNPFGTAWNNMSWGHADTADLLHFSTAEPAMLPDGDAVVYSGCAIINERGLLGLPSDALVYFYTAAGSVAGKHNRISFRSDGKPFTQNIAWSLDGGRTIVRPEEDVLIGDLGCEARDPKVFWNEDCGFYNMILYLDGNRFIILHSADLLHWEETQEFSLQGSWECPDLFPVMLPDGSRRWVFWSADGFYYFGSFDGYCFHTDCVRHLAYRTAVPYAAQTFSGLKDRTVNIPWMRTKNHGTGYTGMFGIPMELTAAVTPDGPSLCMQPVREFFDACRTEVSGSGKQFRAEVKEESAAVLKIRFEAGQSCSGSLCGTRFAYNPADGIFRAGDQESQAYMGPDVTELLLIADRGILEVYGNNGLVYAAFDTGILQMTCDIEAASSENMRTELLLIR